MRRKTRRLLEGLGADARDFQNLHARTEAALLVAEAHNVQRGALRDAGDETQQRP